MPLTEAAIRNAKPTTRARKLSDGGGLFFLVQPTGSKLWRLAYRYAGKQKLLALGAYPEVSLATARGGRDEARDSYSKEFDPSIRRKHEKQRAAESAVNTFRLIAEELLAKYEREGRAAVTLAKTRWLLSFAYPLIGDRPILEISAPDLLMVLRGLEGRGLHESARRLRSACGRVFRYAVATGRAQRDPSGDLRGALTVPQVTHRAAIVEPKAIGALLRAIEGYTGHPVTAAAMRLASHVFVRPGELRHAEWAEFDLDQAVWSIPAEKMKMRRPHRVPLSRQSIEIIRGLQEITGNGKRLFPSVRTVLRPISENTLNGALRRLGYASDDMSAHGFRAMAATRLNEMGRWNPDAIERQMAHQEQNAVRRAYTHGADYWAERVEMMQVWSDYLDELRAGGLVVPFVAVRK